MAEKINFLIFAIGKKGKKILTLNNEYIKFIFGLKLKNLRQTKKLSLSELAKKCGMSVSYLNEIEAGKKYPKSDKIAALANALGVSYDKLVSLKLSNKLAPVTELIASGILEKLPLEHYGLDVRRLLTIMADAPAQLSALIATLIDLAKTSEMRRNVFSRTALRTYKEINDNYFDELETLAEKFRGEFFAETERTVSCKELKNVLQNRFGYEIDVKRIGENATLSQLRAVLIKREKPKLFLNPKLSAAQKKFILGKEIYYEITRVSDRAFVHSDGYLETFDQLLNNFKASYFSTALALNKKFLIDDITEFFSNEKFEKRKLVSLIKTYDVSPEMLFQRIANLATNSLGLHGLFFMRFNTKTDSEIYSLSKEVKLNISHYPGGYQTNEHYCRRWISIRILQEAKEKLKKNPDYDGLTIGAIRSEFYNTGEKFLAITIAKPSKLTRGNLTSVTLGFPLIDNVKAKIKFWNDAKIRDQIVNDTCESCPIENCELRAAEPIRLREREVNERLKEEIENLS